jgi:hypothetical protein
MILGYPHDFGNLHFLLRILAKSLGDCHASTRNLGPSCHEMGEGTPELFMAVSKGKIWENEALYKSY